MEGNFGTLPPAEEMDRQKGAQVYFTSETASSTTICYRLLPFLLSQSLCNTAAMTTTELIYIFTSYDQVISAFVPILSALYSFERFTIPYDTSRKLWFGC